MEGVRLYADQALYKEPFGGYTPWHCDAFYWPLATDKAITAWIPLQVCLSSFAHTACQPQSLPILAHVMSDSEEFLNIFFPAHTASPSSLMCCCDCSQCGHFWSESCCIEHHTLSRLGILKAASIVISHNFSNLWLFSASTSSW